MAVKRFFIPPGLICDSEAKLPDDEARHLKSVMRIREGAVVEIFDGGGGNWSGTVEFRAGEVFVCGLTRIRPAAGPAPASLVLAMAVIKPARFEWALEKAAELGASEIIPLYTARGTVRVSGEKDSGRIARWGRIVREASKQCMRPDVPHVRPPVEFRDFLPSLPSLPSEGHLTQNKILFHEKSINQWLPDRMKAAGCTIICIGPEGGWTEGEVEFAEKSGCGVFGLGHRVLRAETAAVAALSVCSIMQGTVR